MNELIKINSITHNNQTIQTVNARDLHEFMNVGKAFWSWIKARIDQYSFIEGQDYIIIENSRSPNRDIANSRAQTTLDYHLTLDMAKELAMVERNDKGKQARQYFLECERRALQQTANSAEELLSNPTKLRAALISYSEKVETLQNTIKEQLPKVIFHDAVADAINCQTIQEAAKILGTGPIRLFKYLKEEGIVMANNLPYQNHIDAGHFKVIEKQRTDRSGETYIYTRTLITGKGLTYIQKRLQNLKNYMQHPEPAP